MKNNNLFCFRFCKKVGLSIMLLTLAGCGFLVKSQDVISMEKFEDIVNGRFKKASDFVNVFPKSVADVEKRSELIIEKAKNGIRDLLSINPEQRSFDNTARALDKIEYEFSIVADAIEMFEMVSPKQDIRRSCHDAVIKLRQFAVDAFNNVDIYNAFKDYEKGNEKKEDLNPEQKYFLQEAMRNYKRQGFDLPKEQFEKVKEIKKELAKLCLEFDTNINLDKSFIAVEKKDLEGIEADFIENLKKTKDGKYILGCDYPTYFEVMEHCKLSKTRKDLLFKFMNRAYPENIKLLNSIINRRDELAKILKFNSFADLDLDAQMVKKQQKAREFLIAIAEKSIKKADKEFEMLKKDLPEGVTLDENGKMYPWDGTFAVQYYKKKHFDVDEREIMQYFPVENTLSKIFKIYQKFLGLKFKPVQIDGLWHKDVKAVEIYQKDSGKFLGTLFLDLYPRDNKYKHACMADIVCTTKYKDITTGKYNDIPGLILVVANFPKATKTKPALLKHSDVKTFFHEFGHAMHGLLGKTELANFSGTSVKRDFVEMPSQMFEEWMWDKDILKMISSHYKTGEPLPDELIDKKIALKKLFSGNWVTRQCFLSFLALDYFDSGENKDTDKIKRMLHEKYMKNSRYEPDLHFQASFGHLTGYGAKYYGYMWAKVFSLDLFYQVKESGLLNSEIGKRLEELVLSKGGSVEPDILLKNFLGREPNQKAFFKDLGMI